MNIRAKLIGCLFAVSVMFITSFPVYAAPGDGVIYLADATATSYDGITIDGYYSDWENKPYTEIYRGPTRPEINFHLGALFRDATFVYLHIKMNPVYSSFQGYDYHFTVDGTDYVVEAVRVYGGKIEVGITALVIKRQSDNTTIAEASGFVTHGEKKSHLPDEWELKIPLSYFSTSPDSIGTITFRAPKLGQQVLTSTGTPTWPFVVAGSGLIIAFAGYRQLSKRKRSK